MTRKKQLVKGQIKFSFCLDKSNFVVQSTNLISARQSLKLNSAKLIRACIMQVEPNDTEFKPYIITISELSELLNIDSSNLYRNIEEITDDIMKNPIYFRIVEKDKERFKKMPWVSFIEYDTHLGLCIKLNENLKPYILELKKHYTQYTLDEVLTMKSVHAIRVYELIKSRITQKILPKDGISIQLSLDEIKEACDIQNKKSYDTFANLRIKIIDVAVKEINENTMYRVSYEYIKKDRTVIGINFLVNCIYH
jgi:plasmid replication initiation protein